MKRFLNSAFNRAIAIIAVIAVICSTVFLSAFAENETAEVWNGTVAAEYAGGTGTETDPFLISDASQLAKLVNEKGEYTYGRFYRLTENIVINGSLTDSPKEWYSLENGDGNVYFAGSLNGAGHTVSGLYINKTGSGYWSAAGLFPRIESGAHISSLGIVNSSVTLESNGFAGAFFGIMMGGKTYSEANAAERPSIEGCFADDMVSVKGKNAGGIAGCFMGELSVTNCYFTGTLSAEGDAGAFAANHWTGLLVVTNSFATSKAFGSDNNAKSQVKFDGVYTTAPEQSALYGKSVSVTAAQITGSAAPAALIGFDFTAVWKICEGAFPQLRVFSSGDSEEGNWDGSIASDFSAGNGTEAEPYLISTPAELALTATLTGEQSVGKYFKLNNNIVINSSLDSNAQGWFSVENESVDKCLFRGTFDGNGHTVSGLYFNAGGSGYWSAAGLFPRIGECAVIKNLGITDSSLTIKNNGTAGAIAGFLLCDKSYSGELVSNRPTIENCYADETVSVTAPRAGGLIGTEVGEFLVENCYFTGNVSGASKGAVCGAHWGNYTMIKYFYSTSAMPIKDTQFTAVYTTDNSQETAGGVTAVAKESIIGDNAAAAMPLLDFASVWQCISGKYPILRVFNGSYIEPENGIWNGGISPAYASGSGTAEDPYRIETAAQLARLITDKDTAGKYYSLEKDIVLNDTKDDKWYETGTALEWFSVNDDVSTHFCGYFEGNGHSVAGLFYGRNTTIDGYRSGLFPMIGTNAVIRNVHIRNSYLKGFGNTGAVVGWARKNAEGNAPVISGCSADESVTVKGLRAGGIVCASSCEIEIDNCCFRGVLAAEGLNGDNSTPAQGAMLTYSWVSGLELINCYSVDYPIFNPGISGTVSMRDCYSNIEQAGVRVRSKEQMTGDNAPKNMTALDWKQIWQKTGSYPELNTVPRDYKANGYNGKVGEVWSGQIAENYAGGTGTAADPYLIATGEQLAKFVNGVVTSVDNPAGVYYKLTADIILNDTASDNWHENAHSWMYSTWSQYETSKGFRGSFDGNGHIVSGIYLDVENKNGQVLAGLIPVIGENGEIKNVGVTNSFISGYDLRYGNGWIGGIVGYCHDWKISNDVSTETCKATISGCFVDKTVTVGGQVAGGILGATPRSVLIENCYSLCNLVSNSDGRVGGIFGYAWNSTPMTVRNCYSATAAKDYLYDKKFDVTVIENCYAPMAIASGGGSVLSLKGMRGENAKKYMNGFDFENIWYACSDGTPVLRIFGTTSKYSNTSPFDKVEISFVTNGGSLLDPIYGEEGNPINFPKTTRDGYSFAGWYVYRELDVEFPLTVFPMNSITLYAKWNRVGYDQGFETYDSSLLGSDYELYRFTQDDFDAANVHDGLKSVHRIGADNERSRFVLFDSTLLKLEPGKEYRMSIWVKVAKASDTVQLDLIHQNSASADARILKSETLSTLRSNAFGSWQQLNITFIANGKYIALESSGGASIFFDDMYIVETGKTGRVDRHHGPATVIDENEKGDGEDEIIDSTQNGNGKVVKKIIRRVKRNTAEKTNPLPLIIIISVVGCAAIGVAVFLLLKRKAKNSKGSI